MDLSMRLLVLFVGLLTKTGSFVSGNLVDFGDPSCVNLPNDPVLSGWTEYTDVDDSPSAAIPIGFDFQFYGQTKTQVYINPNGNLSFDNGFSTYSSSGFPTGTPMIAAFWTDVFLRSPGGAWYQSFNGDTFVVTYFLVEPYSYNSATTTTATATDAKNTFQIILKAGTSQNVRFCYGQMEWAYATATVGVNAGDNTNYVQLGRFDSVGNNYDGPGGNNDGILYLAETGTFAVAAATENVGPISGGSGAGGDPHFFAWNGKHYEYHGHCDLVLVRSDGYSNAKGLSVHIRSSPFKTIYSYISEVAIKIGHDLLEFKGKGTYYFNGQEQDPLANLHGDINMEVTHPKARKWDYTIYLDNGTTLKVRDQRGWFRVTFYDATAKDFGSSVGLMGTFKDGRLLGRDGEAIFDDRSINQFGMEWQVKANLDGVLFQTPSPFPDKCALPIDDGPSAMSRRRLAESSISYQDAARACARWGEAGAEYCIRDVMISEDLEMAEGGPY